MQLLDAEGWKKANEANPPSEPYGHRVITYSEEWANLMERDIAAGKTLEECAEDTSREADTDGITGFMYGAAVSTLSQVWIHGEALRRWHNRKYLTEEKAKDADASGGVVNPAIVTIKT